MQPLSQVEIENEIRRLTALLETETETFGVLAEDEAKKSAGFKRIWAKTYLAGEGSIANREAWANWECGDEMHDAKIAEALLKAKREKLTSLRTSIDALRTLSANVRVQT